VDLGFGADPTTTQQWQRSLLPINPSVEVVGVEIDKDRVAAARDRITAIHGGFEIPTTGSPLLIRAANVLRQYSRDDVAQAWRLMSSRLAPGGWLVDGTCDEQGRLTAMISIDADGSPRWFTISCRLQGLQQPSQVAARLPKALIHENVPGTPVGRLLRDMDQAWAAAPRWGARQRWIAMADALGERWPVRDGVSRWRLGEFTVGWDALSR
jgi:hypothetical protein